MEDWQKDHIKKNLPDLLEHTDFNIMVNAVLESKDIFSSLDINKLKAGRASGGKHEENYIGYNILVGREFAYETLLEAFEKTKQSGAATILLRGIEKHKSLTQLLTVDPFWEVEVLILGKLFKMKELFNGAEAVHDIFKESLSEKFYQETFVQQVEKFELVKNTLPPKPLSYVPRLVSNKIHLDAALFEADCPDIFVLKISFGLMIPNIKNQVYSSSSQLRIICSRFIALDREEDWDNIVKIATVPVHLINCKRNPTIFVLEKSSGQLDALKNYGLNREEIYMTEAQFVSQQSNEKDANGICICDTPGNGKTLLLANIARSFADKSPTNVVIFISLVQFFQTFSQPLTRYDKDPDCMSILQYAVSAPECSLLLFNLVLNKLITVKLFLDDFDKIQPIQVMWMEKCLATILTRLPTVKIYIASKPDMKTELERYLRVVAHDMLPFDKKTQIDFLVKFWSAKMPNIPLKPIQNCAQICLDSATNNFSKDDLEITGIPLLCQLIAEVYLDKVKQLCSVDENTSERFTSHKLCEMIKKCINLRMSHATTSQAQADKIKKHHIWCAIKSISPEYDISMDFSHLDEENKMILKAEIMELGNLKDCQKFKFVNKIFRDFLIADYFADILSSQSNLAEMEPVKLFVRTILELRNDLFKYNVIIHFLDTMFSQTGISSYSTKRIATVFNSLSQERMYRLSSDMMHSLLVASCKQNILHIFRLLKDVIIILYPNQKVQEDLTKDRLFWLVIDILDNNRNVLILQYSLELLDHLYNFTITDIVHHYNWGDYYVDHAVKSGNVDAIGLLLDKCTFDVEKILKKILRCSTSYDKTNTIKRKANLLKFLLIKYPSCISEVPNILVWEDAPIEYMKILVEFEADLNVAKEGNNFEFFMTKYIDHPYKFHELIEWLLLERKTEALFKAGTSWRDHLPCIFENGYLLPKTINSILDNLGLDVSKEFDEENLLFSAVRGNDLYIVQELIKRGVDPKNRGRKNKSLLHVLKCYVDENMARYLLTLGLDSKCLDDDGNSPIHNVWNLAHAKCLVDYGADVTVRNKDGKNVFHTAPAFWDMEFIEYLVSKGLHVNDRDDSGNTAIYFCRNLKELKCFEKLGADIFVKNKYDQNVLHAIAAQGISDIKSLFEYLLFRGLNIKDLDRDGKSPLDYCTSKRVLEDLKPLLNIWG